MIREEKFNSNFKVKNKQTKKKREKKNCVNYSHRKLMHKLVIQKREETCSPINGGIIRSEVDTVSVQFVVVVVPVLPKLIGEAMRDDSRNFVGRRRGVPGVPDVGVASALPLDRLREDLETMEPSLADDARVRVPVNPYNRRLRSHRRAQTQHEPFLDQVVDSVSFEEPDQSAAEGEGLVGSHAGDSALAVGD